MATQKVVVEGTPVSETKAATQKGAVIRKQNKSAEQQKVTAVRSDWSPWAMILAAIILGLLIWHPWTTPVLPVVIPQEVATATPEIIATVVTNQNPIAFAQAETCETISIGETRAVENGMTITGDVSGETSEGVLKDFFQSDIGEYTVLVNVSGESINVKAPYGAGCLRTTDINTLVLGEINNPNHNDLVSVRVVVYTTPYTYTETWYGPDGKIIK